MPRTCRKHFTMGHPARTRFEKHSRPNLLEPCCSELGRAAVSLHNRDGRSDARRAHWLLEPWHSLEPNRILLRFIAARDDEWNADADEFVCYRTGVLTS